MLGRDVLCVQELGSSFSATSGLNNSSGEYVYNINSIIDYHCVNGYGEVINTLLTLVKKDQLFVSYL